MKAKAKLIGSLCLINVVSVCVCFSAVTGDPLIIGSGHSAVNVSSSIAGGQNNSIFTTDWATIGGGAGNTISNGAIYSVICGGELNTLEEGAETSTIGGGAGNRIHEDCKNSFIGGGYWNDIDEDNDSCVICGGFTNRIRSDAYYAFIGGGTDNIISNNCSYATIVGGINNWVNSDRASIVGGQDNIILQNGAVSTIAGGYAHRIDSEGAAIGGGGGNIIATSSAYGTISGGYENGANAAYATVPGGRLNVAAGQYSFAAGYRAKANHSGAFVWADSQNADFASTTSGEASFRCAGGVRFTSAAGGGNQTVAWTPGSASWSFSSDRNLKEGVKAVDARSVLEKVSQLPVAQWNYIGYSQQHIGPMAQDFHALFPLNDSQTTLNDADLHGVTLAAIQGLHEVVREKESQVAALQNHIERIQEQAGKQQKLMDHWSARLTELEKRLEAKDSAAPVSGIGQD